MAWQEGIRAPYLEEIADPDLESVVDDCVEAMQVEGKPLEACLETLGPLRQRLEPVLLIARSLSLLPRVELDERRKRAIFERITNSMCGQA